MASGNNNQAVQQTISENTWDSGFDASNPLRCKHFSEMRTNAYLNKTPLATIIEIYAAVRLDEYEDKWAVMKYMFHDIEGGKPVMKTKPQVIKEGTIQDPAEMSFGQALLELGRIELLNAKLENVSELDVETVYPEGKQVAMDMHFHNLTYYKVAANIEGVAFDELNKPFRRVRNTIVGTATFNLAEFEKSVTSLDRAAKGELKLKQPIESGILADIFNTVSARTRTMDNFIKTAQRVAAFDEFATLVGALYLTVQDVIGNKDKFDKITGIANDEERKKLYNKAQGNTSTSLLEAAEDIIPAMNEALEKAKDLGAHTEPFEKFTSEAELYLYLLDASMNREELERALLKKDYDSELVNSVTQGADKAKEIFLQLGGTEEEVDKLKAWVMNPDKEQMAQWIPGLLSTYYGKKTEYAALQAGKRDSKIETIAADVKPPLDNTVKAKLPKKDSNQP